MPGRFTGFFRGEVRRIVPDVTIPNSICFSPDGTTAYYTGATMEVLHRIACDPKTGLPTGAAQIFHDQRGGPGVRRLARWSMPTACCGMRAGAAVRSTPIL